MKSTGRFLNEKPHFGTFSKRRHAIGMKVSAFRPARNLHSVEWLFSTIDTAILIVLDLIRYFTIRYQTTQLDDYKMVLHDSQDTLSACITGSQMLRNLDDLPADEVLASLTDLLLKICTGVSSSVGRLYLRLARHLFERRETPVVRNAYSAIYYVMRQWEATITSAQQPSPRPMSHLDDSYITSSDSESDDASGYTSATDFRKRKRLRRRVQPHISV